MAALARTATGGWKAVIRRRGWPAVSKTFRTKRDATDWARAAEDEMVRGVFLNRASSHRLSIDAALQRYFSEVTPTKRGSTAYRERARVKVLSAHLGRYSLLSLSPEIIAGYRDRRLGLGKSPNTVRLELALLSHVYTVALREWRLGPNHNPVLMVRKPVARHRERRLSGAEVSLLLQACDRYRNPMLGWMVRLALESGMRLGEIGSIKVGQVDLERRLVRLTQTKNGSARTVPLTRAATLVLRSAILRPGRPLDTELVFCGDPGRDGKRSPYRIDRAWWKLKRALGLEDLHFHDLRHEAVSRLVELGLSDQEVSAISGHQSMQMLKRYTHLRAEDLVRKLDQGRP